MVSLSKYFIIFARQNVSEEDIHNTEWQNTHDLAVVALPWKVENVAQHSKEKINLRHPDKCNRDPSEIIISAQTPPCPHPRLLPYPHPTLNKQK